MKKNTSTISIMMTSIFLSLIMNTTAYGATSNAPVDTDFGPVYYLQDGATINYEKTACKVGLQFFVSEKGKEYDEFMNKHFSNPDSSTNLLKTAIAKYNAYRDMLNEEFFKYRAKSGATSSSQFELLDACHLLIQTEIENRQTNLRQNFKAGAQDRKSVQLSTKYKIINERFKDNIHFPFAEFLGRMKSFSDGLPCYTNKCSK